MFVKRSFISDRFSNWKHAVQRFNGHEKSDCHRAAVSTLASAAGGVNPQATKEGCISSRHVFLHNTAVAYGIKFRHLAVGGPFVHIVLVAHAIKKLYVKYHGHPGVGTTPSRLLTLTYVFVKV